MCYKVGKDTGKGRALFDTTGEYGEDVSQGGHNVDLVRLEKVSYKLNISMSGAAVETEGGTLHF